MAGLSVDLFSIICRTCLMQKKIFPIEQVHLEEGTLMDLLQNVIFAEEQKEGMPTNMCEECIQEAAVVFKFLVKCKSSNQIIKEMLKTREDSTSSTPEKKPEENQKTEEKGIFGIEFDDPKDIKPSVKHKDSIEENMKEIFGLGEGQTNDFEISYETQNSPESHSDSGTNTQVITMNIPKVNKENIPDKILNKSGQVIHPNHDVFPKNVRPRRINKQPNSRERELNNHLKSGESEEGDKKPKTEITTSDSEDHSQDETEEGHQIENNNEKECKTEEILVEHEMEQETEHEDQENVPEGEFETEVYAEDHEEREECEEGGEFEVEEMGEEEYEDEEFLLEDYEEKPQFEDECDEERVYNDEQYEEYIQCPEDDATIEQNIKVLEKTDTKNRGQHKMNYSKKMEPIEEIENMCYCCSDCDAPFLTYQKLAQHKAEFKHKSVQVYVCPECNNRYRRYTLFWEHIQGHMGLRTYACYACNKTFIHKREVQNHINEVHLKTKEFGCDECGKVFTRKSNLTTHQKIHAGTYRSICPYCGETVTPTTLWAHKKRHKKEQENGGPAYQCHVCEKIVTTEEILQDHMDRIHGPKTTTCDLCGKKCSNEKTLKEHTEFVHRDGRFECRICGNIYKQKSMLKDHIRNYHAVENTERYRCGVCSKEFNYKSSLRDHMRTHTGDPRLECKHCGKTCLNNRQYKIHLKTHAKKNQVT